MWVWFRLICPLKENRTLSQHDGVCFLYSNFSPQKSILSIAFMGGNIGFPSGDSWVRPKSTLSNIKGNNEYPLHIYLGGAPPPGMPGS